jgi:hypothetical protein
MVLVLHGFFTPSPKHSYLGGFKHSTVMKLIIGIAPSALEHEMCINHEVPNGHVRGVGHREWSSKTAMSGGGHGNINNKVLQALGCN